MKPLLADSSAVLAFLGCEPGGDAVAEQLADICLTAVNLAEVVTVLTLRGIKKDWIESRVLQVFATIVPLDREMGLLTGTLATLTQKHGLSLGDRACLAAGIIMNAKVLTADKAWRKLNHLGIEIVMIR